MTAVGVVAIGLDEAPNLSRCLASVRGEAALVVYVDAGSTDESVAIARRGAVDVLELEPTACAARARNAGLARLRALRPDIELVLFIDGDCELVEGWLDRAAAELAHMPDVAVICGCLHERSADRSIYRRLCQIEWDAAIGEVDSCGGIFLARVSAIDGVGGFDSSIRAGEEPELCHRLRQGGWRVIRRDAPMAVHDSGLAGFGDWWDREARNARGALEVYSRFSVPFFAGSTRSARLWGVGWPLAILLSGAAAILTGGHALAVLGTGLVMAAGLLQVLRVAIRQRRSSALGWREALACAALTMLAKWAQVWGQLRYAGERLGGARPSA